MNYALCIDKRFFDMLKKTIKKDNKMYVILVYDFGEKRVSKMLKLCRKYLNWIQNSVFEGEITELQLKQLESSAKEFMDPDEDSIIVFSSRSQMFMNKHIIGVERNTTDNFL